MFTQSLNLCDYETKSAVTGSVVIVENINSSNSGDNSARGATCDFNLPRENIGKFLNLSSILEVSLLKSYKVQVFEYIS